MADQVKVNSVRPADISPEMVAYLLTASIAASEGYSTSVESMTGTPIIYGKSKKWILQTYLDSLHTVKRAQGIQNFINAMDD